MQRRNTCYAVIVRCQWVTLTVMSTVTSYYIAADTVSDSDSESYEKRRTRSHGVVCQWYYYYAACSA